MNGTRLISRDRYGTWVEKYAVAGSTGKEYTVSKHKDGWWGCSCTGWTTNRKCKHLTSRGLSSEGCPPTNKQLKAKLDQVGAQLEARIKQLAEADKWRAEEAKKHGKAPIGPVVVANGGTVRRILFDKEA